MQPLIELYIFNNFKEKKSLIGIGETLKTENKENNINFLL